MAWRWVSLCGLLLVWVGCSSQTDPAPSDGMDPSGMVGGSGDAMSSGGAAGAAAPTGAAPAPGDAPSRDAPVEGSTGGDPATSDAPSGIVPGADYFPLVDGAVWVYRHEGGTTWDEEVTMSTTRHAGMGAMEVRDTPGPSGSSTVAIFVRDGSQVRRVHKVVSTGATTDAVVDYTPGFVRFDDAWLGMGAGTSVTLSYQRVEADGAGMIVSQSDRSHTFEMMVAGATVTVPAGTFEGCLEIRRNRIRAAGVAPGAGDVKSFWFCPEVGKVKELDEGAGKTEELISCTLPGCSP